MRLLTTVYEEGPTDDKDTTNMKRQWVAIAWGSKLHLKPWNVQLSVLTLHYNSVFIGR